MKILFLAGLFLILIIINANLTKPTTVASKSDERRNRPWLRSNIGKMDKTSMGVTLKK